jgi:ABC-2 type transport system ATP-binding protein
MLEGAVYRPVGRRPNWDSLRTALSLSVRDHPLPASAFRYTTDMDLQPPMIVTRGLTKRYGNHVALRECSLEVRRGEVFGLLGPNGAGKTTLLRLLMGFLRPTAGQAQVDGIDCHRHPVAVHRQLSYLPGEARLYRHLRGRQLLRLFAQLRGEPDEARASDVAQRLDLDLSRRVYWMSTGMRQKLALAVTLSAQVPLLILDEPTANLDPTVRGEVLRLIAERRAQGTTVVFSSHVLSETEEVCDRVAILREGRLVHTQSIGDLRRWHRVRLRVDGPVGSIPDGVAIRPEEDGWMVVEARQDLTRLLHWLASLPIREMSVQPVGLRAVYDRFHSDARGEAASPVPEEEAACDSTPAADGVRAS